MGLSCKQVSSDGSPGWSQSLLPKGSTMKKRNPQNQHQHQNQNQQQPEPLKCPRCDSSNTKFCYYNNYNKSQPRYYCKACKRHWTKGGTLRNVPVGGGRKNKRHKASNNIKPTSTIASASKTSTSSIKSSFKAIDQRQQQNQELQLPLPHGAVEGFLPPSTPQHVQYYPQSDLYLPTLPGDDDKTRGLEFPFSSSSSFETTPSSISTSFQSPSIYNYNGEAMKDPTITSGSHVSQTWQVPNSTTSCGMDMDNMDMANWNLDDIDALVSSDLNIHWDDSEIKLP